MKTCGDGFIRHWTRVRVTWSIQRWPCAVDWTTCGEPAAKCFVAVRRAYAAADGIPQAKVSDAGVRSEQVRRLLGWQLTDGRVPLSLDRQRSTFRPAVFRLVLRKRATRATKHFATCLPHLN